MINTLSLKLSTIENAKKYSPWPDRLTGKVKWEKSERKIKDVLEEYDKFWYGELINMWKLFSSKIIGKPTLHDVIRFYNLVDKKAIKKAEKNRKVYRTDAKKLLISIGEKLFITNFHSAVSYHYGMIINEMEKILQQHKSKTIVELGSGSGSLLFRLFSKLTIKQATGGEICPNAVNLGNLLANETITNISFKLFNFYNNKMDNNMLYKLNNYIIYTSHSIEQIPKLSENFIESIINLQNPPKIIVHFEPLFFHDKSSFNILCQKYLLINNYNTNLLSILNSFQEKGKIEILKIRKRIFGLSAFNPTSIIIWKPL